jgi:hypothetical protein
LLISSFLSFIKEFDEQPHMIPMNEKIVTFICLVIAPLTLVSMELFHPSGYSKAIYENLLPHRLWWIILHIVQPLFFSLTGLGGIILSWNRPGIISTISKVSFFLFIVYYTVYDSVAGIGTGVLIDVVKDLPDDQKQTGIALIQSYFQHPYLGGSHTWLSEFASFSWLIGIVTLVGVLLHDKKPIIPILFLLASGGLIWYNHGFPTGPIGFSCFLIGATWITYCTKKVEESN